MARSSRLLLRYMRVADVPTIAQIDSLSFSTPWPERSYRFEVNESHISFMVVLEDTSLPQNITFTTWHRWWQALRGDAVVQSGPLVAYGGLWNIDDEGHISTIASHPDYRGRHYGEIVLVGMIRRALHLGASYIVLEVRVSNEIAQRLYRKYGFVISGTKQNYYHDDKEDAYDMRFDATPENCERFEKQYAALQNCVPFVDDYSHTSHPRIGR